MSTQRTVLVIEDEDRLRQTIAAYLEDSGYLITQAANGRKGIEVFAQRNPDIVLTDLRMPDMNGVEVVAWLRENSPHTPIIVFTGTGDQRSQAAVLGQGVRACIAKPIHDLAELEAAIEQALLPKQKA